MYWLSKKRTFAVMTAPSLILYSVYLIFPIIISIYYSMTKFSGIGVPTFIGLKNYRTMANDPNFWIALKNSLVILAINLVVLLVLAFLIALLLNVGLKGAGVCKAMIFSPYTIAPIIIGIVWLFILDPKTGFINLFLQRAGLPGLQMEWIGGKSLTPVSIGFVHVWQHLGFITTIFIAGLKMVPAEIHEASLIDGAGFWNKIFYITLPMIKDTIFINIVLIITGSLKIFEVVLQLTNGGPNHLSEVLVTYTYNTTFIQGRYGYGMSIAVAAFVLTILISSLFLRITRSDGTQ